MIGNTIKFMYYLTDTIKEEREGIVVDAYTNVTGTVSGKYESILGFGEGRTTGSTKSKRIYKVEYIYPYTQKKIYIDVADYLLIEVVKFAKSFEQQETNEEKIITKP